MLTKEFLFNADHEEDWLGKSWTEGDGIYIRSHAPDGYHGYYWGRYPWHQ